MLRDNKRKKIDKSLIFSASLLTLFLLAIVYVSFKFGPTISDLLKDPDFFRDYLLSFGNKSIFVFIVFQILQVVIAVIPGEIVQLAGGYVYGIILGTFYSLAGIFVGSVMAFFISRILGYSMVKKFAPQNQLEKFQFLVNSPKYEAALFLLFIFPGFPKDILTYIAGLTPIKPRIFFILTTIARLPGIFLSACIGSNLQEGQYISVMILSAVVCCITALCVIFKDRVMNFAKKL